MESGSFRAKPRMPKSILTVVEDLTVDRFVSVVTVFLVGATKVRLLQEQLQFIGFHLLFFFLFNWQFFGFNWWTTRWSSVHTIALTIQSIAIIANNQNYQEN